MIASGFRRVSVSNAPRVFLKWTCTQCAREEQTGRRELVERLRGLGMLRRDDRRELAMLLELAKSRADDFRCPACNAPRFLPVEAPEDDFDDLPPARACLACGAAIPRERLAYFPESTLCAACQGKVDNGQSLSGDDYCERCGTPLVVRKTSVGVTRYQQVCPHCRR
jgi:hypothetical protein